MQKITLFHYIKNSKYNRKCPCFYWEQLHENALRVQCTVYTVHGRSDCFFVGTWTSIFDVHFCPLLYNMPRSLWDSPWCLWVNFKSLNPITPTIFSGLVIARQCSYCFRCLNSAAPPTWIVNCSLCAVLCTDLICTPHSDRYRGASYKFSIRQP